MFSSAFLPGKRYLIGIVAVLVLVMFVSFACTPPKPKQVTIRDLGEIVNMDAHLSSGNNDYMVFPNIYSRLVYALPDDPTKPLPDLATTWSVSSDGLKYTFNLRKGVKWHKGYGDLTSADVVWTYRRQMDKALGSRYTGEWAGVQDVQAPDANTVVITLKQPDPTFLYAVLAKRGWVMNQKALTDLGDKYSSGPIGSGPYVFESWTRGEQLVLVKNPGHWLHKGNVDRAVFKFIQDDAVAELALKSGDIDIAFFEVPQVQKSILTNKQLKTFAGPGSITQYLQFTIKEGRPQADARVRQALSMAIDREAMAEALYYGMGSPAHSFIHPLAFGYVDDEFFPYDPVRAMELLTEAGYPNGFTIDVKSYPFGINDAVGAIVQDQWRKIGVDAKFTMLERALFFEERAAHKMDLIVISLTRDFAEEMMVYVNGAGIPVPNISDYTGIDDLFNQLKPSSDFAVRAGLYRQIQEQLAADVPVIPLTYPYQMLSMRDTLSVATTSFTNWMYPVWLMTVTTK